MTRLLSICVLICLGMASLPYAFSEENNPPADNAAKSAPADVGSPQSWLKKAYECAKSDKDFHLQSYSLAIAMAEAGMFEDAMKIIQEDQNVLERYWGILRIAEEGYKAGKVVEVTQIYKDMIEESKKHTDPTGLLQWIGNSMCKTERVSEAMEIVPKLCGYQISYMQVNIVEAICASGQLSDALQVARQIDDLNTKIKAFCMIAEAYTRLSKIEDADKCYSQAVEAASKGMENYYLIAQSQARVGKYKEALESADVFRNANDRDTCWMPDPFVVIATIRVMAGMFDEALAAVREIPDPKRKSEALVMVGEEQARLGKKWDATKTFDEAITAAKKLPEDPDRRDCLDHAIREEYRAGMFREAIQHAKEARYETYIIVEIAEAQAKAGKKEDATKTFDLAFACATAMERRDILADHLALVAQGEARSGVKKNFDKIVADSFAAAKENVDAPGARDAFCKLIDALAVSGDKDRAAMMFHDSLALLNTGQAITKDYIPMMAYFSIKAGLVEEVARGFELLAGNSERLRCAYCIQAARALMGKGAYEE